MNELIALVEQWANDRGIIESSTTVKQLDKTYEELAELQRALGQKQILQDLRSWADSSPLEDQVGFDIEDAFGDILVTLIIAARIQGVSLSACLLRAYDVIKERKGIMVAGKFIKEEDIKND